MGIESYIRTLNQGMSDIRHKSLEEMVDIPGLYGIVANLTVRSAIEQLCDAEIKTTQQLHTIKEQHSYVGEI